MLGRADVLQHNRLDMAEVLPMNGSSKGFYLHMMALEAHMTLVLLGWHSCGHRLLLLVVLHHLRHDLLHLHLGLYPRDHRPLFQRG